MNAGAKIATIAPRARRPAIDPDWPSSCDTSYGPAGASWQNNTAYRESETQSQRCVSGESVTNYFNGDRVTFTSLSGVSHHQYFGVYPHVAVGSQLDPLELL